MKYFTIKELSASYLAEKNGVRNTPDPTSVANLKALADNVLDPARELLGKPIIVSSGYRSEKLNKMVGGQPNSQHLRGQAADIVGSDHETTRKIFELIRDHCNFDQLLFEHTKTKKTQWVHVSFRDDGNNRHQCIDNYIVTK